MLDPGNQYALLHLGISYQQLGRAHEAAKALEATTALNPKDQGEGAEYLYHYLCLAYIDTEDYDNALEAFGKAAVLSPTRRTSHDGSGRSRSSEEIARRLRRLTNGPICSIRLRQAPGRR